jgi:excisionase family DNA binding protein
MISVPSSPRKLLSREEAAAYLGVKVQTLAVWASAKRYDLPMLKVGSRVRYDIDDLDRWLASRRIGGAADGSGVDR